MDHNGVGTTDMKFRIGNTIIFVGSIATAFNEFCCIKNKTWEITIIEEPLNVGDIVKTAGATTGKILAIHNDVAWLELPEFSVPMSQPLKSLTRI
jgi:hypothetical protein